MGLTRNEVAQWLRKLQGSKRHEPCETCESLQGLLMQLELDADEDVSDLLDSVKTRPERMHGSFGCSPCPPGEVYAEYLRHNADWSGG